MSQFDLNEPMPSFSEAIDGAERGRFTKDLWYPIFPTPKRAEIFGIIVHTYALCLMRAETTDTYTFEMASPGGYVVKLRQTFVGWPMEDGIVVCRNENIVGIAVFQGHNDRAFFPVKPYSHVIVTRTDSRYLLYTDGTGICRIPDTTALVPATSLLFTKDFDHAAHVTADGGELEVTDKPQLELAPVYVFGDHKPVDGKIVLPANSFRVGSRIETIHPKK